MLSVNELRKNWNDVLINVKNACAKSARTMEEITVLAVSKTHPPETVIKALEAGIIKFGENYAQELKEKGELNLQFNNVRPEWHFIGHLQSNKVKYIAPYVKMIHTVDSVKLALEISKQAEKNEKVISCLLQVNTSGELSKSGCKPDEINKLVESVIEIPNISIQGLMTIGSFSENEKIVRSEFGLLRKISDALQDRFPEIDWKHLSMGMSGDYEWAVEDGATIIRIGTTIFGHRDYNN